MILLQASHIHKSFGGSQILRNACITIRKNEKIGLIGANGCGKSTLLKILKREMEPDNGQVFASKDINIKYLPQQVDFNSKNTVWEEMLDPFRQLIKKGKRLEELEKQMELPEIYQNESKLKQITERYSELQEQFAEEGGYEYGSTIHSVLSGLDFLKGQYNTPVFELSGGQKTRLALAKLLMCSPDVIMLDEPTNYLDMETMSWLEKYLQSFRGSILIVSHDRYFLDKLVNTIYELEFGTTTEYKGSYTQFIKKKAEKMERQAKEYKKQQQEKAHLEEFIQKNIARAATSGRAKAKQKQLQKIKEVDMPFEENKSADIAFDIDKNSGNEVLEINNLAIGYSANDPIVKNINFKIRRGERAALLGPNGTGKTTLLKTAAGHLSPLKGTIETGKNVNIAYHDQELETLSQNKTIIDELWDDFPDLDYEEIRKVLGQFLFRGDAVYRLVSNLSGGEKSRLALAKLMCQKANLLILDEPTNHLDIYSNEALEDTLFNFPGTLLFVSHDRYFLDKISTKVFELTKNGIYEYQGNYSYYVEKKKAVVEEKKSNEVKEKKISKNKARYLQTKEQEKEQRRRRRRIDEIEGLIHNLEKDIIEEEKAINDPEVFTDYEALQEKSYNLNILKDKLNKYFIEWTELNEKEDSF